MTSYSTPKKQNILEAKLNGVVDDIETATTKKFREEELREDKSQGFYVERAYEPSSKVSAAEFLCMYLRRSNEPSLIETARILEVLAQNDTNLTEALKEEQARLLLSNYSGIKDGDSKTIKTTYKEFEQIRKRREKVSAKTLRKLKKYKDVVAFYESGEILDVAKAAKQNEWDLVSPDRITRFFKYGAGELPFIHNNPHLYQL